MKTNVFLYFHSVLAQWKNSIGGRARVSKQSLMTAPESEWFPEKNILRSQQKIFLIDQKIFAPQTHHRWNIKTFSMWQPATDCMEIKRVERRYWAPDSSHEMSEIGKYHPADFVWGRLLAQNYPLTAADIEFFRVNLQNSNCINHCAGGPSPPDWPSSWNHFENHLYDAGGEGGGAVALGHHPSQNKTSLSYFVTDTKNEWVPRLFNLKNINFIKKISQNPPGQLNENMIYNSFVKFITFYNSASLWSVPPHRLRQLFSLLAVFFLMLGGPGGSQSFIPTRVRRSAALMFILLWTY